MLEILSENRHLKKEIEEAKVMLSEINVENLPSYNWGFVKGEKENKQQVALKAHKMGLPLASICELTGLSQTAIQALVEQNFKNKS